MNDNIPSRPTQFKKRARIGGQVRNNYKGIEVVTDADLQQLIDGWLVDADYRRLSARTRDNRVQITNKLKWWMCEFGVTRLDADAMRRFFAYVGSATGVRWGNALDAKGRHRPTREKPISAGTVDTFYINLAAFFSWAVGEGLLAVSPLVRIARPDLRSRPDIEPFSVKQISALLDAAQYSPFPERDTAIILVLLDTGLRVSEATNATIGSVDKTNHTISVVGKGNKPRLVRYGKETSMALWRYLRTRCDGSDDHAPLFAAHGGNHGGQALSPDGMRAMIDRLGREAGIKGVRCSPHTFRHTFALMFLENGGNSFALQHLLGHRDMKMTGKYVARAQSHLSSQHVIASPVDNLRRKK